MPRLDPEFRLTINSYLRKHHADLCRHWFDDVEPLDIQSGVLRLLVREPVQLRYLQRCCTSQFSEAAQSVTGRLLVVRFIGPDEATLNPPNNEREQPTSRSQHRSAQAVDSSRGNTATGRGTATIAAPVPLPPSGRPGRHGTGVAELKPGLTESRPVARDGNSLGHQMGSELGSPMGLPVAAPGEDVSSEGQLGLREGGFLSSIGEATFQRSAPAPTHAANQWGGPPASHAIGQSSGSSTLGGSSEGFAALDEQTLLSPDYTFGNFVVGPNNRLAHAAALAVGEKPGKAYNPFFVHGGVGLGKTHLLQATCQSILRTNPRARISYISCNTFMDLFHDAVRANRMADFRARFRTVDVLVIDDIHFLSKRDQTQEEFFHTFNALYQAGKQIVLSSDAAPSEIPDLEERLTSRFCCGLVARIDRPDYETRVAIIKTKAALHDLTLPDDVPAYIAAKIDSNIRELEGALTKLRGLAAATNQPISLELAKTAMSDVTPTGGASQPTIQMIIEEVSRFFDVKLTDLLSKRRHKSIALPRQVCMWLARKHTRYSLEEIGGYFGGRDHTTVMHAIKTINQKRGADGKLLADVSRLEEQLLLRVR